MIKKRYLLGLFFAALFCSLIGLFALGLNNDPNKLRLATKGNKIPEFSLPSLFSGELITNKDLVSTKPYYLINFWGSWCPSCYEEHPYLMNLQRSETIYGVNWKDETPAAKSFIKRGGNPFSKIIIDNDSTLAIGMGVYGAPETFLITSDGIILHRYAGAMNSTVWQKEFLPKIKQLREK
ncbi:MAG: DsbE family thiol:disulfide interchange protein [Gammaproteobacteria bacterium]|nr:DsbE family thiol:disulfide interchange protein [Gammaproteobacteria bacterium]